MASREKRSAFEPRINNRRAFHEFFIEAKLECGIVLVGSEVKSVRMGRAQLQEAFARVDGGELILYGCHIDPYDKASINTTNGGRFERRKRPATCEGKCREECRLWLEVMPGWHGQVLLPVSASKDHG